VLGHAASPHLALKVPFVELVEQVRQEHPHSSHPPATTARETGRASACRVSPIIPSLGFDSLPEDLRQG
jgi:hypothetical protein